MTEAHELTRTRAGRICTLYAGVMALPEKEPLKKDIRQWPADSLEGMPPKKRRFIVWWLLFSCLLYPVVAFPLRLIGVPYFIAVIISFLIFFVVAIPVIRAARREKRELFNAKDEEPSENDAPGSVSPGD